MRLCGTQSRVMYIFESYSQLLARSVLGMQWLVRYIYAKTLCVEPVL